MVVVAGTVVVVVVVVVVVTMAAAVKLSVRWALAFSPAGTFTFWPSPVLSTSIVSLVPVVGLDHCAGGSAGYPVERLGHRPRRRALGDAQPENVVSAAVDQDVDGCLLTGGRAGDGLGDGQGTRGELIGVGDVSFDRLARRHRDVLGGALSGDGEGVCPAVGELAHRARRTGRDVIVRVRRGARGGPGRETELRRKPGAVANNLDTDRALMPGGMAGDRLAHDQRARRVRVRVRKCRVAVLPARHCHMLAVPGHLDRRRCGCCRPRSRSPAQAEPAAMWWYVCEYVPAAAPAGTLSAGESGDPLQTAWTVTAPCWPAAGPAIVLVTLK